MSTENLVDWLDQFLFGAKHPLPVPEPFEIIVQDLEARGIHVEDTIQNGGLILNSVTLETDLATLLDFRARQKTGHPIFRTRSVTSFYNQLRCLEEEEAAAAATTELPEPTHPTDAAILESILLHSYDPQKPFSFQDANYWGQLAQRLIQHRKPPGPFAAIEPVPLRYLEDVQRLYDVTCQTLGRIVPPFQMRLVTRSEYMDPIHWRSIDHLHRFLQTHPGHPLLAIVRSLLDDYVLHGHVDTTLMSPQLVSFLSNLRVIHDTIQDVQGPNVPPKLVNVFQRLLTLAGQDHLWNEDVGTAAAVESFPSLHVYEKIFELEKQNALLWNRLDSSSTNRRIKSEHWEEEGCL